LRESGYTLTDNRHKIRRHRPQKWVQGEDLHHHLVVARQRLVKQDTDQLFDGKRGVELLARRRRQRVVSAVLARAARHHGPGVARRTRANDLDGMRVDCAEDAEDTDHLDADLRRLLGLQRKIIRLLAAVNERKAIPTKSGGREAATERGGGRERERKREREGERKRGREEERERHTCSRASMMPRSAG
jgi:hypothetical protein